MTTACILLGALLEAAVVWRIASRVGFRRGHAAGIRDAGQLVYPEPEGARP